MFANALFVIKTRDLTSEEAQELIEQITARENEIHDNIAKHFIPKGDILNTSQCFNINASQREEWQKLWANAKKEFYKQRLQQFKGSVCPQCKGEEIPILYKNKAHSNYHVFCPTCGYRIITQDTNAILRVKEFYKS